ncbi:NUDIX domain-containing protein [Natrialbaceae archaeon A-arb3/5]
MSESAVEASDESHVVTAFLRHRGEVLLCRRSDAVSTYAGSWGGVSGFAEGDPDEQVRVEIREETGLEDDEIAVVRSGRPIAFEDPDLEREWVVHPYLFDCEDRTAIELSEEHDEFAWVPPTAIVASESGVDSEWGNRETVPKLWTAYERVAPTVRSIAADGDHGAAYLSVRALEVLRDRAGLLVAEREESGVDPDAEWDELAELAERLLEARPAMGVLRNRVNRAMADAVRAGRSDATETATGDEIGDAPTVLAAAISGIERAVTADDEAAANAGARIDGTVLTLSRSGTVLDALRRGSPSRVFVAESRPAREGVAVAEALSDDPEVDCPVTLHTDAAAAHVLAREDIERVLVGADTVRPDGSVVNKTGTRGVAAAASLEGVPVTVVAATDKVSTRAEESLESGDRSAVYDGDASIDVVNPTFDVTPANYVTELVTERGVLEPGAIEPVVEELYALESWHGGVETETTDRNHSVDN